MFTSVMTRKLRLFAFLAVSAALPATAASFSFQGAFGQDDQQAHFSILLSAPATLTMLTLSYGGGVNFAGDTIARGGFDPILSLYAGSGPAAVLINLNNDGSCPPLTQDSVTNACWDSYIQTSLPAGFYTLVLTQSDNGPLGATLGDGFLRDGQGNFTGPSFIGQPGSFWDSNPNQRDGHWAVDILDVDDASAIPEPASIVLVGAALSMLALVRVRCGSRNHAEKS